jgi:hypothetical protein
MGRKRQSLDFSAKPRRRSGLRAGPVIAAGIVIGLVAGAWIAFASVEAPAEGGERPPVSYETLSRSLPALTRENFAAADLDGDGLLDAGERAAAEAAGLVDPG